MISREDLVEQSVTNYARTALFTERSYPSTEVEMRESFPYELNEKQLTKNIVALGFNFDDEGHAAEMGSDLTERLYTIEFFVFGLTNTYGRNLANVLKFALTKEPTIPLLDIAQTPPVEIDQLLVEGCHASRVIVPDPEPWQEFVWTTTLKVTDFYHARLV